VSIRNLDALFKPGAIALIGGTTKAGSTGGVVTRNLLHSGFEGPIMPVHGQRLAVEGVLAYPSIAELPVTPDLGVVATPPDAVAETVSELGARGARAAVVLTDGFGEDGSAAGMRRRQAVLDAAQPHMLRLLGPNCIGAMGPRQGLNATFARQMPKAGDLGFVTQSGAMVMAMLDWARPRGIGFSHIVSLGDMLDVDFGDCLDYLANDNRTRAILMYVEAITDARKFMSAARAAARTKPVIVIKGGRHTEGAQAAARHTGAAAGTDAVYDAAFRRAGMLRVTNLHDLFDAAETLAMSPPVKGDRMTILTNGGGLGVLAADALIDGGGRVADLSEDTIDKLNAVLPAMWSARNPVDIIGDATGDRYAAALKVLLAQGDGDAVLVINCPGALEDPTETAEAVIRAMGGRRRPLFAAWLGSDSTREARTRFAENRVPSYETPEDAVRGFLHLVRHRRSQDNLMETPPSLPSDFAPETKTARDVVAAARRDGHTWLREEATRALLAAYGLRVAPTEEAGDAEAAVAAAERLGYPVALKVRSPEIRHKGEVGGVELELDSAAAVRAAAERMRERVGRNRPDARIEGFTVQRMVRLSGGIELALGIVEEPPFGPVLLFGQGGPAWRSGHDVSVGLPPLNMTLARRMVDETRVARLLDRDTDTVPGSSRDAAALALIGLSQMLVDLPDIAEVSVNPLLTASGRAKVLDARIRLTDQRPEAATSADARLAIRPYPRHLEKLAATSSGLRAHLRPIRPEDEPALQATFKRLDAEDIRLRFFSPMRELSHRFAARLTQIDYDREMAFVATNPDDAAEIWGVVRLTCDPDNEEGEYAVLVRSDLKGQGLGYLLMREIIAHGEARGLGAIVGDVLNDNRAMLQMCRDLGFRVKHTPDDPQIMRVTLPLHAGA
jgi:acetyltransferase